MSGRHQPLHGADSAEAWVPRPFLVLMEHRYEEGERIKVRVPAAIGPRDAKQQAAELRPGYVALQAEDAP
jgi:hypothetical protein